MAPRHRNAFEEIAKLFEEQGTVKDDFVSRLFYYINEKGKTNAEVYTAALMTADCFSKIISKKTKNTTKDSAIALSFGLELTFDEAQDLLSYAGYFLSQLEKRDMICRYFFEHQPCDIFEVNEALERFGFPCLGVKR